MNRAIGSLFPEKSGRPDTLVELIERTPPAFGQRMATTSSLASNAEHPISTVKLRPDTHREGDRTLLCLSPVTSSKVPEAEIHDRTRPVAHDRTQACIRSTHPLSIACVSVRH